MRHDAIDLSSFVTRARGIVAGHAMGQPGAYRRWSGEDAAGGPNPYGCADAANILYTIGAFPGDAAERAGWIGTLQSLQDSADGLFHEATHHPIHTTAHCVAALELFDARPPGRLAALAPMLSAEGCASFLAGLDWRGNPWRESHRGAGLFAALVLAGEVDAAWQDAYFAWLWDHADPATGLLGGTGLQPVEHSGAATLVPHMASTFHYLFNQEWAHRPHRYPERLIDTCLDLLAENRFPLGRTVSFAEIDWFYCVNRSLRQSGHRRAECLDAMERLGRRLAGMLHSGAPAVEAALDDLHLLFGTLCAMAELQQALPGLVRTDWPLKLVLDRRPFI